MSKKFFSWIYFFRKRKMPPLSGDITNMYGWRREYSILQLQVIIVLKPKLLAGEFIGQNSIGS
jgi:hypothetical protein